MTFSIVSKDWSYVLWSVSCLGSFIRCSYVVTGYFLWLCVTDVWVLSVIIFWPNKQYIGWNRDKEVIYSTSPPHNSCNTLTAFSEELRSFCLIQVLTALGWFCGFFFFFFVFGFKFLAISRCFLLHWSQWASRMFNPVLNVFPEQHLKQVKKVSAGVTGSNRPFWLLARRLSPIPKVLWALPCLSIRRIKRSRNWTLKTFQVWFPRCWAPARQSWVSGWLSPSTVVW